MARCEAVAVSIGGLPTVLAMLYSPPFRTDLRRASEMRRITKAAILLATLSLAACGAGQTTTSQPSNSHSRGRTLQRAHLQSP